jgi:hypothetical protein
MCPGAPPKGTKLNKKEQAAMDRAQWWIGEPLKEGHMGYAIEMRTRPQTIGVAFNDNPVGIMMFIGEKYQELADPNLKTATLENVQFNHDLCTTLSLYFFTPPSIMTSMLCYYNNVRHEVYTEFNSKEENLIRVPLGVSTFPYDAFPVPKAGAETTTTNLQFFKGKGSCEMHGLALTMCRIRPWRALCVYGVPEGNGERYAGVLPSVLQDTIAGPAPRALAYTRTLAMQYIRGRFGRPSIAFAAAE